MSEKEQSFSSPGRCASLTVPELEQSKTTVLGTLVSAHSRRSYKHAIEKFIDWYCSEPRLGFNRPVVVQYRSFLERCSLSAATINLHLSAIRRLADEAAESGLLSAELAIGIRRVKGVRRLGRRIGNWLNRDQAQGLLSAIPQSTLRGKRDAAILGLLLGCGLRRSEAISDPQGKNQISPVCGYLMPNHLDGALEFFDVDGSNLGFVRPQDDSTVMWEEAPGQPSTAGKDPSLAIPNPHAAGIASALVRWGITDAGVPGEQDDALQAILRLIDSTLWSVDPYGHSGDEHLALLVGHPVVIVRARLTLDLLEPIQPELANLTVIPIRLGALAHWQDGLFGYFVNDDYTRLFCSDAAAAGLARQIGPGQGFLGPINSVPDQLANFAAQTGATPIAHPYIETTGRFEIRPDQSVNLTLLVEPHSVVHATAGLLPRKEIGLRRDWTAEALAKLSPTFRFGPVLVDPQRIRMPIPVDLNGTWSWDYRAEADTWAEMPVTNATQDALLPPDPPSGTEGWLRLTPPPTNQKS